MRSILALIFFAFSPVFATAHEFWIAPVDYVIDADQPVKAQLRIGQKFEGAVQRFYARQITRFEVIHNGMVDTVTGRLGDDPALSMEPLGDGLVVVVHETNDSILTYRKPELFPNFTQHKGVPDLLQSHKQRGFPETGFQEKYRRFAKSLIASGSGIGQDVETGMRAEIIALANPYTDDLSDGLPVKILFNGKPRADAFVEVFARQVDGAVTVSSFRADGTGIAVLPVRSGVEYLVDATLILPLDNQDVDAGPVWESLWASLTFLVPLR